MTITPRIQRGKITKNTVEFVQSSMRNRKERVKTIAHKAGISPQQVYRLVDKDGELRPRAIEILEGKKSRAISVDFVVTDGKINITSLSGGYVAEVIGSNGSYSIKIRRE